MAIKRVNLGSGTDYRDGWINIDIAGDYQVDLVADLHEPFPFKTGTIQELLASDILEHFTKEDGERFLTECHRVLEVGGIITIRTHNIYRIYENFHEEPDVFIHFVYGNTEETGVFGAHKFAYTRETLERILKKLGFTAITIIEETTNFLVTAKKASNVPKRNLHIAVIQQTPAMGGAEEYMLSLITQMQLSNDTISFASNLVPMSERVKHAQITYIPFILDIIGNFRGLIKSILLFPYAMFFYARLLDGYKKSNVDVILMSGFSEKLLVTALAPLFDIPVVWIEYGKLAPVFRKNWYLPKILYRTLKDIPYAVIVPSKHTKHSLLHDARVNVTDVHVIPCGTQILEKRHVSRKKLGLQQDSLIIGNVSRLTQEKGQHVLLRALPEVLKTLPNAHLIIIGTGATEQELRELIAELHLESHVTLAGYVENLQEYYAVMDIFAFPTMWDMEGFGLVLPEAMINALPVVASNIGPVPEIVDDNKTGLLFTTGDSYELAKALIHLGKDPKKRASFGKAGEAKVRSTYDITISSQRVRDLLRDATL